ncbi:MAG: type III secretion system chaperone family protein, partial [Hyphococcus sp.]
VVLAPAAAQTIDAVTGEQLESALSSAGLGPTMTEDAASGAPVATGMAGEFEFYVRAIDCSGTPAACENLIFFANFPLGRSVTAQDYRTVNSFNDGQVFGRAYIIESRSTVGVDYVIELGGGVTEDHLAQNISRWADVIGAFVAKFQEGAAGA